MYTIIRICCVISYHVQHLKSKLLNDNDVYWWTISLLRYVHNTFCYKDIVGNCFTKFTLWFWRSNKHASLPITRQNGSAVWFGVIVLVCKVSIGLEWATTVFELSSVSNVVETTANRLKTHFNKNNTVGSVNIWTEKSCNVFNSWRWVSNFVVKRKHKVHEALQSWHNFIEIFQ